MTELADKIEAAEGPSRELDAEIAVAIGLGETGYGDSDWTAKPYTASLDAALSLVPEGAHWSVSKFGPKGGTAQVGNRCRTAATPALALCAAALRAGDTDAG